VVRGGVQLVGELAREAEAGDDHRQAAETPPAHAHEGESLVAEIDVVEQPLQHGAALRAGEGHGRPLLGDILVAAYAGFCADQYLVDEALFFHLAGHAHADERPGSGDLHRHTSIDGTRRLLDGCGRDVRRLLFVSSVKAMCERTPAGCVDETARPAPTTAYGRARLEAERLVLAGAPQRHVVVLRLPLVYGAGARGNLARMLAAIDRGRMPLLPEFRNRRSLVHVGDVAEGAIAAVRTPACSGRVYLLTDGDPYSTREIQVLMFGALGRALPRRALPRRALGLIARAGDGLRLLGVRSPPLDSAALARLA